MSLVAGNATRSRANALKSRSRTDSRMGFQRINEALCAAMEKPPPPPSSSDGTVFVCQATKAEWDAFTVSEDPAPALKPNYLAWCEATNAIHIIEFPPYGPHDALMAAFIAIFNANALTNRWLVCRGGSSDHDDPTFAPDVHFGPASRTPGAVRPRPTMPWADFNTIKVEIGVAQRWGEHAGQLDHKAVRVWPTVQGVEYVLCVKTNDDYSVAEYKLYDLHVRNREDRIDRVPSATPIVFGTTISLDAYRVLGIPRGTATIFHPLPPGFPNPFTVSLDDVVEKARVAIL